MKGKIRIYISVKRDEDESTTVVNFENTHLYPHEVVNSIKRATRDFDDSPWNTAAEEKAVQPA